MIAILTNGSRWFFRNVSSHVSVGEGEGIDLSKIQRSKPCITIFDGHENRFGYLTWVSFDKRSLQRLDSSGSTRSPRIEYLREETRPFPAEPPDGVGWSPAFHPGRSRLEENLVIRVKMEFVDGHATRTEGEIDDIDLPCLDCILRKGFAEVVIRPGFLHFSRICIAEVD